MMLCKRRHADTPTRRYVSPSRPIFNATLRAAASWLFFCVARSTRMTQIWALYRQSGSDRLEKQPTDLRRRHHYMRDGTLGSWHVREEVKCVPDDQQTEHSDRGDDYGSMWPSAQCRNCYLSATGVGYVFWQVGRRGYGLTGCIGRGNGWFIHKTAVSNIVKLPNANQRRNLLVVQNRRPLLAYHLRLKRTRPETSDRHHCERLPIAADAGQCSCYTVLSGPEY